MLQYSIQKQVGYKISKHASHTCFGISPTYPEQSEDEIAPSKNYPKEELYPLLALNSLFLSFQIIFKVIFNVIRKRCDA